jgi:hypothetical protein
LSIEQAYNPVVPVRIYFTVGWYRLRSKAEINASLAGPPPSPEGYEDYVIGEGKNFGPDSWTEMVHAKGIPFPPGMSLTGAGGKVIEMEEESLPPKAETQPNPSLDEKMSATASERRPSWIPWLITSGLVLGLIAVVSLLLKRKASV